MPAAARVLELAGAVVEVFDDPMQASKAAALRIAQTVRSAVSAQGKAVLGLATGATPETVYAGMVSLHQAGELSFAQVQTFNLDEYYPISPVDPNSYRFYMHKHLFAHVDLPANHAHVLDGTVPEAFAAEHAAKFDRWIEAAGGFDLQLLGIGRNGHIGFNEPSDVPVEAALAWPTRLVELHPITKQAAVREFGREDLVPPRALTVGIAPILAARSILVLAFGSAKAEPVAQALKGPVTAQLPGSLLQQAAGQVTWMLDRAAASLLV